MRRLVRSVSVAALALAAAACDDSSATAPGPAGPARMEPNPAYLKKGDERRFAVRYVGQVRDVPEGAKALRVWMPVPQDSALQTITDLRFEGGEPTVGVEAKHGNKVACFEVANPGREASFTMSFTCLRREHRADLDRLEKDGPKAAETDAAAAAFLADDKLTIVDDRIRRLADEKAGKKVTTIEKARAIYDHVLEHMTYDKSGQGWGRGDTNFACDVGKGNCTDFHALFMSMARAQGIAAGFEIGLYLPYERRKDEKLGGYHCWAMFRVAGRTWVPVDISEADRDPARTDYFFGAHTSNRVTLSVGRDLVLVPPQRAEPLNYFVNPHAEADGRPVAATKEWSFTDLD